MICVTDREGLSSFHGEGDTASCVQSRHVDGTFYLIGVR
jgi:hypothetical protein